MVSGSSSSPDFKLSLNNNVIVSFLVLTANIVN